MAKTLGRRRFDTMFGDGPVRRARERGSVPPVRLIVEEKRRHSKPLGYSPLDALLRRLEFPNIFVLETE